MFENILKNFYHISQGLLGLVSVIAVILGRDRASEVMMNWIKQGTEKLKLTSPILQKINSGIGKFLSSRFVKISTILIAIIACFGVLIRLDTVYIIILALLCAFVFLINTYRKRKYKGKTLIPKRSILMDVAIVIFLASVIVLSIRVIYECFFSDESITIVVSEFEATSPENTLKAKDLSRRISHYIEEGLLNDNVYFYAKLQEADTVIQRHKEAIRLSKKLETDRAIILWGLITADSYTPHYTLVNLPEEISHTDRQESQFIHDLNELEGPALDIASNALSIVNFSLGLVYYWEKDYESAQKYFEKAAKEDSRNTAILFYLGNCNYYLGYTERAINAYEKFIQKEPGAVAPLNNLAVIHIEHKAYENALPLLEKAIEIDDKCTAALNNLGALHNALGETTVAANFFNMVLKIDPEDPIAKYNLAIIASDYNTKMRLLEEAAESPEAPVEVFINLGYSYYQYTKDYTKSLNAFKKAATMAPSDTTASIGLALVYMHLGDIDKATDWLMTTINNSKAPAKYYQQFGDVAYENKFYELAIKFYEESNHSNPTLIENYARMAHSAYQLKMEQKALEYAVVYTNNNSIDTTDIFEQTLQLGCIVAFNTGKLDTALDMCGRVYRLNPDNKDYETNYTQTLLRLIIERKDTSKVPDFTQLTKSLTITDALRSQYIAQIGNVYLDLNLHDLAIEKYQEALGYFPENKLARHNLYVTYFNNASDQVDRRNWGAALTAYEKAFNATDDFKNRAIIIYNKAYIYQQMGDKQQSQLLLTKFLDYTSEHKLEQDSVISELLKDAMKNTRE